MSNNAPAIVEYIRSNESIPDLVEKYGNIARYAMVNWNATAQTAWIVQDRIESAR